MPRLSRLFIAAGILYDPAKQGRYIGERPALVAVDSLSGHYDNDHIWAF